MGMVKRKNAGKIGLWDRLLHSVWLFPLVCATAVIFLTAFKISGTSVGQYHTILYGSQKDPALLVGEPRSIRSDEWLVRTPKTLAQSNNNFSTVNSNIGQGENESISLDLPYKDWSTVFRPLDWPFFIMSFEYAFALKWWLMAYLLLISAYFFILKLLPGRRLFAACIAVSLLFMPFVQWWYEYDTLASIFFALFTGIVFMNLINSTRLRWKIGYSGIMAYLLVCFALILYPPFQIACALALAGFAAGYLLEAKRRQPGYELLGKIGLGLAALIAASLITLFFLHTRSGVVHAIENTVYPGKRVTSSGGFGLSNFLSGPLDFQLLFSSKAVHYMAGTTNQSEASNFILLLPFLFLPSLYMLWVGWRRDKRVDWPLAITNVLFVVLLVRLFVPYLSSAFNLLALKRVPHQRLIIGIGLLSIIQATLVVRWLSRQKKTYKLPLLGVVLYSIFVLVAELAINFHIKNISPGFIGVYRTIALSLPLPIVIYLILSKRYKFGAILLAAFCVFTSLMVNPFYRGEAILINTPLSQGIKNIAHKSNAAWVAEGLAWENFPQMNGAHSLSGVYSYPQLAEWRSIDGAKNQDIYNRYANVEFVIDRASKDNNVSINLAGPDHIRIKATPCSSFLKAHNVHYLIAESKLSSKHNCSKLVSTVVYPQQTFYIYLVD
jgi:hypothetical protein